MKLALASAKKLWDGYWDKVRQIPWLLGTHAFLCVTVCMLACVLLGAFLFYKYVFSVNMGYAGTQTSLVQFRQDIYTSVLDEQSRREAIFSNSPAQSIASPFDKN